MFIHQKIKLNRAFVKRALLATHWSGLCLFFCAIVFGIVPLYSQEESANRVAKNNQSEVRKPYTGSLDTDWSKDTYIKEVSRDGNWIAFTEDFNTATDTLHLRHTTGNSGITLSDTYNLHFASNSKWFASLTEDKKMNLIHLEKLSKEKLQNITSFAFSYDGGYVGYIQEHENKKPVLRIKNLNSGKTFSIEEVAKFNWNPKNNSLLVVVGENQTTKVFHVDAGIAKKQLIKESTGSSMNYLKWNESGTAAVFTEQKGEAVLLNFYEKNNELLVLEDSLLNKQILEYHLSAKKPLISEDGKRIVFYRHKKINPKPLEMHNVQIWDTKDPLLYPGLQLYKEYQEPFLVTAWFPQSGSIKIIGTEDTPSVAMNVNHDTAIVFDKLKYGLQNTEFPKVDLYVKNILTGERETIVQGQSIDPELVSISPLGKYIAYFKDKHWWVYSIKEKKTSNLTLGLDVGFLNIEKQHPTQREEVFQKPYWSKNDTYIILSDQFDLWKMTPDGKSKERITKGRENQIKYKVNHELKIDGYIESITYRAFWSKALDLGKGQILNKWDFNNQKTGIALWKEKEDVKTIFFEESHFYNILHNASANKIVFKTQAFTMPVAIYSYDLKTREQKNIFQSNKDLLNYDLGTKQLFSLLGEDGVKLNCALIYPANFNPKKKYPMIVYIYDKASQYAMLFNPPSGYSSQGFNALNYITDDYFVLYPDISYTQLQPGISAWKSVNAAVDRALENKNIDKDKIGLIGHSFGGYEAAFIATQTNRFAAIVAGAAVTNVTSHYHGVNWNNKNSDAWRYEDQQWRMGVSYYENKEAYLQNSPLEFVEKIDTPLLLWTGDKDYQITWTQSLEMFMALTRLNKIAKLLLIKEEPHSLWKSENQLKLSREIKKWFDRYCK